MDQLTESAEVVSGDTERAVRPRTAEELKAAVLDKLTYVVSKGPVGASQRDWFLAVAHATRDIVVERWIESTNRNYREDPKRVYYLSLEFLVGRMLFDAMTNVGIVEPMTAALSQLGVDLAALGYGIRYDNGLFRQIIRNGWQQEAPEDWLLHGNPWEFERPETTYTIGFGGWVEAIPGDGDYMRHVWHPGETVEAVAYDTPGVGWRGEHVNTLRLWWARAVDPIQLAAFTP